MKTILLIDDEASIREVMEEMIEMWGYNCITESRGLDGLKAIDKLKPDLVLLDIQMPKMTGIDTLKFLKEIGNKVPIYIISAFTNFDTPELREQYPFVKEFIPKPFDFELMQEKIYNEIGF